MKSKEDKELDEYISEAQFQKITSSYIKNIKIILCWIIFVCFLLAAIYFIIGHHYSDRGWNMIVQ